MRSTSKLVPFRVTPLASLPLVSVTLVTLKVSLLSASLAFCSKLMLKDVAFSFELVLIVLLTTGASLAPLMVRVTLLGVTPL